MHEDVLREGLEHIEKMGRNQVDHDHTHVRVDILKHVQPRKVEGTKHSTSHFGSRETLTQL